MRHRLWGHTVIDAIWDYTQFLLDMETQKRPHVVTPDGVSRGLHSFVVPIRDRETLRTLPGVVVGDMGAKASVTSKTRSTSIEKRLGKIFFL